MAILASSAILLAGCAGFTFYSDAELQKVAGIPIWAPKPYLLVVKGQKDKPIEATVVYLNDPKPIVYAVPRSGWGSAQLSLAMSNGVLTSFGQTTDPKLNELITSLGGFLTSRATADKTRAEADQLRAKTQQSSDLSAAEANELASVRQDIEAKRAANALSTLSPNELATVVGVSDALKAIAPLASSRVFVDSHAKTLQALALSTGSVPGKRDASRLLQGWATRLQAIGSGGQADAAGNAEPPVSVELYEIETTAAGNRLRRVGP